MMIKSKIGLMMAVFSIVIFIGSCDSGKKEASFKTTESGLKYKFIVSNEDGAVPEEGQIMSLKMTYGTEDTLFFSTDKAPDKTMKLKVQKSAYPGDFYEMMEMMHLNDSAVFMIDAASFFTKTAGYPSVPDFAEGIDKLTFNVKLEKLQTEEELQAEMQAKAEELRESENDKILEYIAENDINVEPTESGMYVIIEEKGNGPKPKVGETVKVHYTGTLLDGTKFDSSLDRGQPLEFPIGQGRVIKGWDEGIAMLNVGSKAKLIIPSKLGYGERGAGRDIPPFATLIFEVELIDIVK